MTIRSHTFIMPRSVDQNLGDEIRRFYLSSEIRIEVNLYQRIREKIFKFPGHIKPISSAGNFFYIVSDAAMQSNILYFFNDPFTAKFAYQFEPEAMNNADEINISIMTKEMVAKETGNVRAQSQTEDNFGNHKVANELLEFVKLHKTQIIVNTSGFMIMKSRRSQETPNIFKANMEYVVSFPGSTNHVMQPIDCVVAKQLCLSFILILRRLKIFRITKDQDEKLLVSAEREFVVRASIVAAQQSTVETYRLSSFRALTFWPRNSKKIVEFHYVIDDSPMSIHPNGRQTTWDMISAQTLTNTLPSIFAIAKKKKLDKNVKNLKSTNSKQLGKMLKKKRKRSVSVSSNFSQIDYIDVNLSESGYTTRRERHFTTKHHGKKNYDDLDSDTSNIQIEKSQKKKRQRKCKQINNSEIICQNYFTCQTTNNEHVLKPNKAQESCKK
ncbi:MAG: hypothetical protein EZS28_028629 [Streblomastix strix]|uniref:Uncharacterized protein n=1 Tax=Streblomastix strix TaxID=222440 RepID=A0A5J4V025_9EUKA|nr:MAG: hypothetical protein EZS28_028629 [Streblomastix strix]